MKKFKSDESFVFWDYAVSHQKLLIRSNGIKSNKYSNIDIIFIGVFYLNIPTLFSGLELSEIDADNFDSKIKKESSSDKYFSIKSGDSTYIVGANHYYVYYNNLEFDDSSIRKNVPEAKLIASSV